MNPMEKAAKILNSVERQGEHSPLKSASQSDSLTNGSQSSKFSNSGNNFKPWRRRTGVATDLTKVKSILSKVLAHRGLDKKVERYGFILHWHEIVGERLAEVSKPDCIVNRQLIVNVMHPVWAQELTMIKPVLLESLAKYMPPGDLVRDMIFKVRPIS